MVQSIGWESAVLIGAFAKRDTTLRLQEVSVPDHASGLWSSPLTGNHDVVKVPHRVLRAPRRPHGPTRTHQDPTRPTWTHQDPHGPHKTHMDPTRPTRTPQDPHGPHKTHQDPTRPTWTPQDPPGPHKTHMDPHGPHKTHMDPTRTHQDPTRPTWTHQDPHGPHKTHQDPTGSAHRVRLHHGKCRLPCVGAVQKNRPCWILILIPVDPGGPDQESSSVSRAVCIFVL
ncbi:Actin cytoskeleton-regulatory complex protein pan1 [Liparis tanakae]|uniref:Actin cytoskeleton-regulatory complex protein pan1 n=1 Tax=Liparis tanakae TaxID=230148 RepID=A0A4Z2H9U7_9TELE|nr:Actin cytoskeleton-regulatory complex protein pan1 [Liparis tanakae]